MSRSRSGKHRRYGELAMRLRIILCRSSGSDRLVRNSTRVDVYMQETGCTAEVEAEITRLLDIRAFAFSDLSFEEPSVANPMSFRKMAGSVAILQRILQLMVGLGVYRRRSISTSQPIDELLASGSSARQCLLSELFGRFNLQQSPPPNATRTVGSLVDYLYYLDKNRRSRDRYPGSESPGEEDDSANNC